MNVEKEVLDRWKVIDAFQTQLQLSQGNPTFTFYDGPPFGTCRSRRTMEMRLTLLC